MNPAPPLFFDLSARAKFRISGADRLRFLNGQMTNDLRRAGETEAIEACVTSGKGKIDAHLFISRWKDDFIVDCENASLPARLNRYIIADDVEIEDVTERFGLFHVLASAAPAWPAECRVVTVRRFLEAGFDLWVERAAIEEVRCWLEGGFSRCDASCAETLRIESGLPRAGFELTDEIIPVEANLEARSIDYEKGCYIGQEVISRMKMSGQTNKRLCGLVALDGALLEAGTRLTNEEGRDAGWVTSATHSERLQRNIALGFVKRGFNEPGSKLRAAVSASGDGAVVEVVPLPFV